MGNRRRCDTQKMPKRSELISLEQKYYPAVRDFYQTVRTRGEQQVVLQSGGISGGN